MLIRLKDMIGFTLQGSDSRIGKVRDFYFDDQSWTIRYVVADTGRWLPGRSILISPVALGRPDTENEELAAHLEKEHIEESPLVEEDLEPVSREMERGLVEYYGWPEYWGRLAAGVENPPPPPGEGPADAEPTDGPALRSALETVGYAIHAQDGQIGRVEDMLAGSRSWKVRYLLVHTEGFIRHHDVLISPTWVEKVHWGGKDIHVTMNRDDVAASPEYDPAALPERAYEAELFRHYGRSGYWHGGPADREE